MCKSGFRASHKFSRLETDLKAGRPLIAYGQDSFSGVELRNWIRMKFGVELSVLGITSVSLPVVLYEKVVRRLPRPEVAVENDN